jgi:hypothetical protein
LSLHLCFSSSHIFNSLFFCAFKGQGHSFGTTLYRLAIYSVYSCNQECLLFVVPFSFFFLFISILGE